MCAGGEVRGQNLTNKTTLVNQPSGVVITHKNNNNNYQNGKWSLSSTMMDFSQKFQKMHVGRPPES